MQYTITKTDSAAIQPLRNLFLQEFNNQFIYDKCHYYGWADCYLFNINGAEAGYGAVWGTNDRSARDSIFECYLLPPYRKYTDLIFQDLITTTGASVVECQSNDIFLHELLCRFCENIKADSILFKEHMQTELSIPGTIFRKRMDADVIKADDADYVLDHTGTMVAYGGLMLNYNFPYADIYMHVPEPHRHKGYGSLIVQEFKKLAYSMGRVPAARCNINNHISKATLEKAGFKVCGIILTGTVKKVE